MDINAYYREENIIWMLNKWDAYLYKLDYNKAVLEQVIALTENPNQEMFFTGILSYKDYFIFTPGRADFVLALNRHDFSKTYYEVPLQHGEIGSKTRKVKFLGGIIEQDCLYMFGNSFPGILKLDFKTGKFLNINKWLREGKLQFNNQEDGCFGFHYCKIGHIIYFPFTILNAVLVYDLEADIAEVQYVGDSVQRYTSIEHDGKDFWLIPRDGKTGSIVRWNPQDERVQYYNDYPDEYDYNKFAFCSSVHIGNKILLFAHAARINISIDISTGRMEAIEDLYDVSNVKAAKYVWMELEKDRIFLLLNDRIIWWRYGTDIKETFFYYPDTKVMERWRKMELKKCFDQAERNGYLKENGNVNLNGLIEYIQII